MNRRSVHLLRVFAVLGAFAATMPLQADELRAGQCTAGDASATAGIGPSLRRIASAVPNASTLTPAAKSTAGLVRGPLCVRPPAAVCLALSCGGPTAPFALME